MQRYYLKIGHVDVRILPVVITTLKDGWFKKLHLQEFVALVSVNSRLLLNFDRTKKVYSMVQQRTGIAKPVMRRQELLANISLSLILFVKMFQIISNITLTKLMKVKFAN